MFQVRWEKSPLDEQASLWTQAESSLRQQITEATNQIDRRLQADPTAESESRPKEGRILFNLPLGITFRIESDGHTISVLHVWLIRRRTP